MGLLNLTIGEKVLFKEFECVIVNVIDLNTISIEEIATGIIHTVKIKEVQEINLDNTQNQRQLLGLSKREFKTARKRMEILAPILSNPGKKSIVLEIAKKHKKSPVTIYRWLKKYQEGKTVSSLADNRLKGGKGLSRLSNEVDKIINDAIHEFYLDTSKKSINRVIRAIKTNCLKLDIKSPSNNTIRNRISSISEEEYIKKRYGKNRHRDLFEPIKGNFPGAEQPLSVVQIDHTPVDIILVDEHSRKPFNRPNLTLAFDVYSRMIIGFHLSFDPVGALSTGLCIAASILPKEDWLADHGIEAEWPCWGVPHTIHVDNAKEFRGKMLKKACKNYNINLEFRPVATPHYGGHVERVFSTIEKEVHDLPGTVFSDIGERENYDSARKATFTIKEFEKWFLIYIVRIYHQRIHRTIKTTPTQKYKEGIFGTEKNKGTGLFPRHHNERRLRLDFMPYVKRTIQEYGVVIDHIFYYHDIMRKYIHARQDNNRKKIKLKFIFRRDPRDISTVYFYDPEMDDYFPIPYRNVGYSPMSIWEHNEILKRLQTNKIKIDERAIFEAYEELQEIEKESIKSTRKLKRHSRFSDKRNQSTHEKVMKVSQSPNKDNNIKVKRNIIIDPDFKIDYE